jgi:hypothetical protein
VRTGYPEVAARAGHRCEYCHAPEALSNFPFFVDHIIPRTRAPELVDDTENLALSCPACNLYKSDHIEGTDPETGELTRLFHPRRDSWANHFAWESDELTVRGLSAIGRATTSLLRLNSQAQRRARAFWLTSEFFP